MVREADSGIVGILLAAGQGKRFGGDKLLQRLPDGTPMALAVARKLRQVCTSCITVLRLEQQVLGELLQAAGFTVHYQAEVGAGMGCSLAAAVRATPAAEGWLVALADMPLLRADTMAAVVRAVRDGATLTAPFYRGQRGHPVAFSNFWRQPLSMLRGDRGARDLLAEHAEALWPVPCDDAGVLIDIDSRAVWDSLFESLENRREE
jgi:molybdenum cofactor cytidylyltransferase